MKINDDMDFRGSSQQVIDFQNKKLRIDDTIAQNCLKEYDKKITCNYSEPPYSKMKLG